MVCMYINTHKHTWLLHFYSSGLSPSIHTHTFLLFSLLGIRIANYFLFLLINHSHSHNSTKYIFPHATSCQIVFTQLSSRHLIHTFPSKTMLVFISHSLCMELSQSTRWHEIMNMNIHSYGHEWYVFIGTTGKIGWKLRYREIRKKT